MAKKAGKVSSAAYANLASAANRLHATPHSSGQNQKNNRKPTVQATFPVILLESIGAPIIPDNPGGARTDLRERSSFTRLTDTGSDQVGIFQIFVEDDCILTVGGFILTATVTAETTEKDLYTLLAEATVTTGIPYASAIVAQNLFIRELLPSSGTPFDVTSTTPQSNTTAANDVKKVSWWPQKGSEECSLGWAVPTAIEGGSLMLAADAGERGIVVVPAISGSTTVNTTSGDTCCECTVITNSDLSVNGVATTSRWDVVLSRDATYIFDSGYVVIQAGTYRITWNEGLGGWHKPMSTTQLLGSSTFVYLTDGTDVSTVADRIDIDVTVGFVTLRFLMVPDNGAERTQLELEIDMTVDDNRPEE